MRKVRITDTASFIRICSAIHNGYYDYSKVVYTKSPRKVAIICPKHGVFYQSPNSHQQGRGCGLCGDERCRLLQLGPLSNNWKGGRTKFKELIRKTSKYKRWRKDVYERDNYTCQLCYKRGSELAADHITPLYEILDKYNITTMEEVIKCQSLWDLSNGRTLCRPCHLKTPTFGLRGYGPVSPSEFLCINIENGVFDTFYRVNDVASFFNVHRRTISRYANTDKLLNGLYRIERTYQ